ncbi:class I SAM-dependent methyltransferase [Dyadobacter sandarakinus]|uniref:Class I SAM-dependent methyltransferase n=1 Tax=Dyadobacter sandarakinus TaxID=2747268 RepID=A0ABX7I9I6_9BACT|nr:class I SAM-dependent methyltransferase [Dyadobacter sandarakinus]QRR02779.1 class I SAM-dependent methyltransferase [Dyadobacter sandarakinus]
MSQAAERATMPKGTNSVLDRRTVFSGNRNLVGVVRPGDALLDVGCGSGSMTFGMAELTGPSGTVTGIDASEHLIEIARKNFSDHDNVHFEVADINSYVPVKLFDVVSAARVLQWLANPHEVLGKMVSLVKPGGLLTILDYNHTKIHWEPEVPESMRMFYDAFLKWRQDAGMNNGVADKLQEMFEALGLTDITVTDFSEVSDKDSLDFAGDISIWKKVAETRGKQLVADGYVTEEQRLAAIADYDHWIKSSARSMKMYLLAVTGRRP